MGGGTLRLEGDPQPWAASSARYRIATGEEGAQLTIAVSCLIEGLPFEVEALLDTGAAWSVVGGALASRLEASMGDQGLPMLLSTRLGRVWGKLCERDVVLVAEVGESVTVSAQILVAPGWDGPIVLGYQGLLERVRFALDPGTGLDDAWFFFARAG